MTGISSKNSLHLSKVYEPIERQGSVHVCMHTELCWPNAMTQYYDGHALVTGLSIANLLLQRCRTKYDSTYNSPGHVHVPGLV